MDAVDRRLEELTGRVKDLAKDLRVLRSLLTEDHGSALNKMRYVTEKILHGLCVERGVKWGKGEPTLENMIGPLIAKRIIPKNVAIHVRTIQTNASPGSHFQESPLSSTHVQVAQIALLELVDWHHRRLDESSDGEEAGAAAVANTDARERVPPSEHASPARASRGPHEGSRPRRMAMGAMIAAVVAGSAVTLVFLVRSPSATTTAVAAPLTPSAQPTSSAPQLREPTLGLDALSLYREPSGSRVEALGSVSWWRAAAEDFEDAAAAPEAPARWRAAGKLARGQVVMLEGDPKEALSLFDQAIAEEPDWAVPHAARAIALSRLDRLDDALAAARRAQRLEPEWYVGVMVAGRVYARARKLEEATQELRRALDMRPDDPYLMAELALVYHGARLDGEAERYALMALKEEPDLPSARLLLAERGLEAGDGREALEQADRCIAVASRNGSAHLARADALALLDRKAEALDAYRKALALLDGSGVEQPSTPRFEQVRAAVQRGELPPPRVGGEEPPTSDPAPAKPPRPPPPPPKVRLPARTACAPDDPLCSAL